MHNDLPHTQASPEHLFSVILCKKNSRTQMTHMMGLHEVLQWGAKREQVVGCSLPNIPFRCCLPSQYLIVLYRTCVNTNSGLTK
jgi:hypothetical protein